MTILNARAILPVVAIVLVAGVVLGVAPWPLSLATDVGLTDETVCTAVDQSGPRAITRLQETGFPHASTSSVEVYRMTVAGGEVKAMVRLDWASGTASCLPLDAATPYTASLDLEPRAYHAVVQEIRSVLVDGEAPSTSLADKWAIITGTSISIPGNEAYESKYEKQALAWAAGELVREVSA